MTREQRLHDALTAMLYWHRAYHGQDDCTLCIQAKAALAPESGGRGRDHLCECPWRFDKGMMMHGLGCPAVAPSSPSSAQGEGPVYCARCHLTEPLHHSPNIYTGRKDARGHPYPSACEAFVAPTDPSLAGGGA